MGRARGTALRRAQQLLVSLARPPRTLALSSSGGPRRHGHSGSTAPAGAPEAEYVAIGDVRTVRGVPAHPELVPTGYLGEAGAQSQTVLQHLRWLMQKDVLGQDMFLLGPPGPFRRRLALQYCEMTRQEVEYLCLSRDTTEGDIKQRREIVAGTSHYVNQCAVRAALKGRVLVIEGIEKAERNLLPIINNLLENREGQLDDGRFLVAPVRYDELLQSHTQEELAARNLLRVHEKFRVVALGLPVPRFAGNPLDPPLRSRFQARDVRGQTYQDDLAAVQAAAPGLQAANPELLERIVSHAHTLPLYNEEIKGSGEDSRLPHFSKDSLVYTARALELCPKGPSVQRLLQAAYPHPQMLKPTDQDLVQASLAKFDLASPVTATGGGVGLTVVAHQGDPSTPTIVIRDSTGHESVLPVRRGPLLERGASPFLAIASQDELLAEMCLSHALGDDLCLIGGRGSGKSVLSERFARALGYPIQHIMMHKDMTARDLTQQRVTLSSGDTAWRPSPLTTAAIEGSVAVLDGLHRVDPGTLTVIQRLCQDREASLHDGTRMLGGERFDALMQSSGLDEAGLAKRKVVRIHPSFRIVALAEPPAPEAHSSWLTEEVATMFRFHSLLPLTRAEEQAVVAFAVPGLPAGEAERLVDVAEAIRRDSASTVLSESVTLSTRHLVRIARRLAEYPGEEGLGEAIRRTSLARFLPGLAREALDTILAGAGVSADGSAAAAALARGGSGPAPIEATVQTRDDGVRELDIGGIRAPVLEQDAAGAMLVPDVVFYNNPSHMRVMQDMLKDFLLGEHLLLVGNQGVGKNKIVDRFLNLMNRPREYIQLHRDTTVQTLTQQPSVEDGHIVYKDSPLIRAVTQGSVLVVDEADKAPTHVVCVLKTLLESGEFTLSDGRRIVANDDPRPNSPQLLRSHKDFRAIILANRPGFPFLGNDFFGSMGDVLSCHAVDNPDSAAELQMLQKYAPSVDLEQLKKLSLAFTELRTLAEEGQISYPYSMRELVSIARHLERFPGEGLGNVVRNIFDFDSYDEDMRKVVVDVLHRHGIPIGTDRHDVRLAQEHTLPAAVLQGHLRAHPSGEAKPVTNLGTQRLDIQAPESLPTTVVASNRSDSRSLQFQEEEARFDLPLHDGCRLTGMVAKDDHIFATGVNSPCLYVLSASTREGQRSDLSDYFSPYTSRDALKVALINTDVGDRLLLYSEHEDAFALAELDGRHIERVGGQASNSGSLVRRLFGQRKSKELSLAHSNGLVLTWEGRDAKIDVMDFKTRTACTLQLPLEGAITSVAALSPGVWLVDLQDPDGRAAHHLLKGPSKAALPDECVPIEFGGGARPFTNVQAGGASPDYVAKVRGDLTAVAADVASRVVDQPGALATLAVNFPGSLTGHGAGDTPGTAELYAIPLVAQGQEEGPLTATTTLPGTHIYAKAHSRGRAANALQLVDFGRNSFRELELRFSAGQFRYHQDNPIVAMAPFAGHKLVTAEAHGGIRTVEVDQGALALSLAKWRQMVGSVGGFDGQLRVEYTRRSGLDASTPKHGKVDPDDQPHVGGNTWAGGTGGRDTAGLGGKGGPYRLDAGHDVHQLSQEEKDAVPDHIKEAARELGQKAFQDRLREIDMSEYDAEVYERYYQSIAKEVSEIKVILAGLEAKGDDREWLRNQTIGDLDDHKLIESITGEHAVYKRRGHKAPTPGVQEHPKRFSFVMDLSASMYRFNGHDSRLERMLEAACMIMEAFSGVGAQIAWEIVGHSGETEEVVLVDDAKKPANEHDRLKILQQMIAHSQFCLSGDHTLDATKLAISKLSAKPADERFVIVMSDANLDIYGVSPRRFGESLASDPTVQAYAIMIGSLGEQAADLKDNLPAGRAFVCMDAKNLPAVLKQVFTTAAIKP